MQNTAQVLLVYQLTHSVFAVGLVTCAQFSGSLFLGPWAAAVASRVGGKRMLIAAQMASAVVAGALVMLQALGSLEENGLIIGALALGLLFTVTLPVQTALVPRLVPDDQRETEAAMAMNSVSYNAGRAMAPALCVVVISTAGFAWAFAFNALSFVAYAVMLAKLQPRQVGKPPLPARTGDAVRVTLGTPRILLLLAMVAAVTFAEDPVLILGPALARHVLHGSTDLPGYFLSALGLGTVLGSLRPSREPRSLGRSWTSRRAAWSLLGLAAAIGVFSAGINTWVCLVAAFAAGMVGLQASAVTQTQLVRLRPRYAASVMALWAFCWAGTKPLASFTDGLLAGSLPHLWMAGAALIIPALILAVAELSPRDKTREWLRAYLKGLLPSPATTASPDSVEAHGATLGSLADEYPSMRREANGLEAALVTNVRHIAGLLHRETRRRCRRDVVNYQIDTLAFPSPSEMMGNPLMPGTCAHAWIRRPGGPERPHR